MLFLTYCVIYGYSLPCLNPKIVTSHILSGLLSFAFMCDTILVFLKELLSKNRGHELLVKNYQGIFDIYICDLFLLFFVVILFRYY